ncbi:MAG TPA: phage holin family protein [Thermodesulfobacteriota bacterium]|nr:phage holin family protein [Thermodesulfobacteriota bacterium]
MPYDSYQTTMINMVLRIIILAAGIFLAAYLVPGVNVVGYGPAIKAAVLLGILNIFIKPALLLFTLPINLLTLGLFTLIINGFLLWFVGSVVSGFHVAGFLTAILGSIIISLFSILLNRFI